MVNSISTMVTTFLTAHTLLAYGVLFLGAYFETMVGIAFVLPGEAFFLPGALLAGAGILNIWVVAIALYLGGMLGDTSSFWIGKRSGRALFKEGNKIFTPKNYKRGERLFKRFGTKAVFYARLLGPLSWITPFLAGAYDIPYRKFLLYNIPGVIVGIGEFLVVGYFFGNRYKEILGFLQKYTALAVAAIGIVILIVYVIKRSLRRFE